MNFILGFCFKYKFDLCKDLDRGGRDMGSGGWLLFIFKVEKKSRIIY